jgi:ABC-type amino acid transport substrate-binding protein
MLLVLLFACGDSVKLSDMDYRDFMGKQIGCAKGSISDGLIHNFFEGEAAYVHILQAARNIRKGTLDGFMTDLSAVRAVSMMPGNEDLTYFAVPDSLHRGPLGGFSSHQMIIDSFNVFLESLEASGELALIKDKWIESIADLNISVPVIRLNKDSWTLRVATCNDKPPFSYKNAKGELTGYSIELALRFAEYQGLDIEFIEMDLNALIPFVMNRRADIALANMSITAARKELVIFTDPIYSDQLGILALNPEKKQNFIKRMMM